MSVESGGVMPGIKATLTPPPEGPHAATQPLSSLKPAAGDPSGDPNHFPLEDTKEQATPLPPPAARVVVNV